MQTALAPNRLLDAIQGVGKDLHGIGGDYFRNHFPTRTSVHSTCTHVEGMLQVPSLHLIISWGIGMCLFCGYSIFWNYPCPHIKQATSFLAFRKHIFYQTLRPSLMKIPFALFCYVLVTILCFTFILYLFIVKWLGSSF